MSTKLSSAFRTPKLQPPEGIKSPDGWGLPRLGVRGRLTANSAIPRWWTTRHPDGTNAEYLVYAALQRLGYRSGRDFIFRAQIGQGLLADFYFPRDGVVFLVRNTTRTNALVRNNRDNLTVAKLKSLGVKVIVIDEFKVIVDPEGTVQDAYQQALAASRRSR
jgi:hypothetical protein